MKSKSIAKALCGNECIIIVLFKFEKLMVKNLMQKYNGRSQPEDKSAIEMIFS